jgi:hypothetical protein
MVHYFVMSKASNTLQAMIQSQPIKYNVYFLSLENKVGNYYYQDFEVFTSNFHYFG